MYQINLLSNYLMIAIQIIITIPVGVGILKGLVYWHNQN